MGAWAYVRASTGAGMKPTSERLEAFLCRFREDHPSFRYGVPEIVRALRVFAALEEKHIVLTEADRLGAYIAPAVCASAEEQTTFREAIRSYFAESEPKKLGGRLRSRAASGGGVERAPDQLSPLKGNSPSRYPLSLRFIAWGALGGAALLILGFFALGFSGSGPSNVLIPYKYVPALPQWPTMEANRLTLLIVPWFLPVFSEFIVACITQMRIGRYRLRPLESDEVKLGPGRDSYLDPIATAQAMLGLRHRQPTGRMLLDLPATISRAARTHDIEPVFRPESREPLYLIFARRRTPTDHAFRIAADFARKMQRAGIRVAAYSYSTGLEYLVPLPELSFGIDPVDAGKQGFVELAEVLDAHLPAMVLVVDDGRALASGEWVEGSPAALISGLPDRGVLTPVPVAAWGIVEEKLEEAGVTVLSADTAGVQILGAWMAGRENPDQSAPPLALLRRAHRGGGKLDVQPPYPALLQGAEARFLTSRPPEGKLVEQLVGQLRGYLEGSAFEWLCALAVYPSIRPDLTRELGRKVLRPTSERPLFDEQDYLLLSRLPWVVRGRMPQWLRRELLPLMEHRLAARVESALLELVIEIRDPDRTAIELPRRDQGSLRTLWNILSMAAPQGSAIRDPVLLEFMSGRLRQTSSVDKSLRARFHEWIGWRIWPALLAVALFVSFLGVPKNALAATLPWAAYTAATCIVLSSLMILVSTTVVQRLSRAIIGFIPVLAGAFTLVALLSDAWNSDSAAQVLLPAAVVTLLCVAIARLTIGDKGDQPFGLVLASFESKAIAEGRNWLRFCFWSVYAFLSYLAVLVGCFFVVTALDRPRTVPASLMIEALIYLSFCLSWLSFGWLLSRKLERPISFRVATGTAALCLIPAYIAGVAATAVVMLISAIMNLPSWEVFSWWPSSLVYPLWGAVLAVAFLHIVAHPIWKWHSLHHMIWASLGGAALATPLLIASVLLTMGYYPFNSNDFFKEIPAMQLLCDLFLWPVTLNPLVIWSSCLGVLAMQLLTLGGIRGIKIPSGWSTHFRLLVFQKRLFILSIRQPTIVVTSSVITGWFTVQFLMSLTDLLLMVVVAGLFWMPINFTYLIAQSMTRAVVGVTRSTAPDRFGAPSLRDPSRL
jgi:hypothetical protein